jgi:hypothetical protein
MQSHDSNIAEMASAGSFAARRWVSNKAVHFHREMADGVLTYPEPTSHNQAIALEERCPRNGF